MQYDSKTLINLLESNYWVIERQNGSHVVLKHKDYPNIISVPNHGKQIKKGTFLALLKAGRVKKIN